MAQDKLMSSGVRELPIFQPLLGLPRDVSTLACGSRLSTLRGQGGPALCGPRILEALVTPPLSHGESVQFSLVQSLSCVRLFATPLVAACQASLSITNSWSSLRLTSIESVMPSSHLVPFSSCSQSLLFTPKHQVYQQRVASRKKPSTL